MSNERRHELETNDLAILLDRVTKAVEPYAKMIALGIAAAVVGTLFWLFYNSEQSGQRSDATLQLIEGAASQDPEVLMEVGQQYPGTAAAAWAKVYQGQLLLSDGIQSLYRDREEAQQLLGEAKSALESAITGSDDPLLRSRAQIGIARAEESLGDLEAASESYQKVIAIGESEAIIRQAEQRIAALSDPETKEFLAWFDDQNFAPADPSLPPSLPGLDTLPDLPDLQMLQLPGGEAKSDDGESDEGGDLLSLDDDAEPTAPAESESSADTVAEEPVAEEPVAEEPEGEE